MCGKWYVEVTMCSCCMKLSALFNSHCLLHHLLESRREHRLYFWPSEDCRHSQAHRINCLRQINAEKWRRRERWRQEIKIIFASIQFHFSHDAAMVHSIAAATWIRPQNMRKERMEEWKKKSRRKKNLSRYKISSERIYRCMCECANMCRRYMCAKFCRVINNRIIQYNK